ncbi:hypothetical protein [Cellulomonas persica]|uniref:Uncharacterized protein n=1 Tax=Cellulomonas persica TaxID=76861 RepID=A0A510UPS6_9CELL|nr:hypothetical protein [Cellulomonas persica]GEK16658.1 hypothetical protein CPE01_03910 [Cellulomonas persica]
MRDRLTLPAGTRPTRRVNGIVALVPALVLGAALAGCSSSEPARLDTPLAASDQPLLTAEPTADATFEPLDGEHGSVGELADGFPTDLVPLPDDADILVSAAQVDPDGAFTEISLNLRTTLSADDLMASLATALTGAGFTQSPVASPPAGVAAQSTFARETGEVVTVAVLDRDGVRTLTLGGRVAVA